MRLAESAGERYQLLGREIVETARDEDDALEPERLDRGEGLVVEWLREVETAYLATERSRERAERESRHPMPSSPAARRPFPAKPPRHESGRGEAFRAKNRDSRLRRQSRPHTVNMSASGFGKQFDLVERELQSDVAQVLAHEFGDAVGAE